MLGVPPLLSHIFDGLLPKGEEDRGTTPRLWCENEVRNHGTQTLVKCISHPQNVLKVTWKGIIKRGTHS